MDVFIYLLFEDQFCVILASIGAFVMTTKPAFWDKDEQTLHPISRNLFFNKNLIHEDGFLGNYIASDNQITYTLAMDWLRIQVQKIHLILNKGEKFTLENLGELIKNDQTITFMKWPKVNLFFESFGLDQLQIEPKIQRKDLYTSKETKNALTNSTFSTSKNMKNSTIKKKNNLPKKNRSKLFLFLFLLFLAFILVAYLYYNTRSMLKEEVKVLVQENSEESSTNLDFFDQSDIADADDFEEEPISNETFEKIEEKQMFQEENSLENPVTVKGYHLIAGVFKVKKNAEKLMKSLHSSGFPKAYIVDSTQMLYRVSFGKLYSEEEKAKKDQLEFKKMGFASWIFVEK